MDKPLRVHLRLLALFLPLTAVLYIAAEAVNPEGTDRLVDTTAAAFQVLPIAARHSGQLDVSGSLTIAALGAPVVSYAAIATLIRGRGWVIATAGALLGGLGAFCGAIVNVLVGVNLATAASAHMTSSAAAQFLVTSFNSPSSQAFTLGLEIAEAQSATGPVVVLFMLPFTVAMVLLAARIWRAAAPSAGPPDDHHQPAVLSAAAARRPGR
jgi:hypothetical protein